MVEVAMSRRQVGHGYCKNSSRFCVIIRLAQAGLSVHIQYMDRWSTCKHKYMFIICLGYSKLLLHNCVIPI